MTMKYVMCKDDEQWDMFISSHVEDWSKSLLTSVTIKGGTLNVEEMYTSESVTYIKVTRERLQEDDILSTQFKIYDKIWLCNEDEF